MDEAEIAVIDSFFGQGLHWNYLYSRMQSLKDKVSDVAFSAISFALGHMLEPDGNDLYPSYGPLPPIWQMNGRISALPASEGFATSGAVWVQLAEDCKSPAAVARFNDLLWVGKSGGKLGDRGRRAVAAYMDLAQGEFASVGMLPDGTGAEGWMAFERAHCLQRALQIALELRDPELVTTVRDALVAAFDSALSSRDSVGAGFVLARTLTRLPKAQQPLELRAQLESGLGLYGDTAHNFEEMADLLASLASSDTERKGIRYSQVDAWLNQASQSEGLIRLVELQKAAEFARRHGLADRIDSIRREIDGFDHEQLNLKEVSVEVTIPEEAIEAFISHFTQAGTWEEALALFGAAGGVPPSGDFEENVRNAQELETRSPLLAIVPTIVVDDAARPIRHVVEREDKLDYFLNKHEQSNVAFWTIIGRRILERLLAKLGKPDESQMVAHFTTPTVPHWIAERFARGLALYFDGQMDECVHVLVPRIEASIREVCLKVGIPVAREATPQEPGGVAPLGALLHDLGNTGFDQSWCRYLVGVLTEQTGLNLRNRVSHGLIEQVSIQDAVVLLHIACFLALVKVEPVVELHEAGTETEQPSTG